MSFSINALNANQDIILTLQTFLNQCSVTRYAALLILIVLNVAYLEMHVSAAVMAIWLMLTKELVPHTLKNVKFPSMLNLLVSR